MLDLGLPTLDGLTVLKRWRRAGRLAPVLILTARGHGRAHRRHRGRRRRLRPQTVRIEEVLARVRALIRRSGGFATSRIEIGDLVLDTRGCRSRAPACVPLTPQEYRLVAYLAHQRGRVVSQLEITEHLYAQDFERDSNSIEVLVGRVRKLFGSDIIRTRRGFGYAMGGDGDAAHAPRLRLLFGAALWSGCAAARRPRDRLPVRRQCRTRGARRPLQRGCRGWSPRSIRKRRRSSPIRSRCPTHATRSRSAASTGRSRISRWGRRCARARCGIRAEAEPGARRLRRTVCRDCRPDDQSLSALSITARFKTAAGARSFRITVAEDRSVLDQSIARFGKELAVALLILGATLVFAAWLQVRVGLKPLARLREAIEALRRGSGESVPGTIRAR